MSDRLTIIYKGVKNIFILSAFISCSVYCINDEGVKKKPPSSQIALVAASDFQTGFLSAFSLDGPESFIDIVSTHSDALVRHQRSRSLIINRLGRDNITILDPQYKVIHEFSTGRGSNPHDVVLINDELAAVSLFERKYLSIFNINSGREINRIDLSSLADEDGIPEIHSLYANEKFLYASVQRLDRNHRYWLSSETAYLAKISLQEDFQLEKRFLFPFGNPISKLRYLEERNSLLITAAGNYAFNYKLDGGVLEFDLTTETFKAPLLKEADIGFEISDAILVSPELGFIIGNNPLFESCFAAFNPSTGSLIKILLPFEQNSWFSGLEVDSQKRIYLGDRHYSRAGIRIFAPSLVEVTRTAERFEIIEMTGTPVSTGLPPVSIALVEN